MAIKSCITYFPPKDRFVLVSREIVKCFDAEVVGVYCKIVELSAGKSLNVDFVSKRMKISEKKTRRIMVLLEEAGYITRNPIKDERGRICAWNYCLYSEPVSESLRSHAGKRVSDKNSTLPIFDQGGKPTKVENGKGIISNNDIIYNNRDYIEDNKKECIEKAPNGATPTQEELTYIEKMKERFPRIMRLDQPLTLEQAKKLKEKYDRDLLAKVMQDLEYYKPLHKKYVSAYYVINKWCQMELERS